MAQPATVRSRTWSAGSARRDRPTTRFSGDASAPVWQASAASSALTAWTASTATMRPPRLRCRSARSSSACWLPRSSTSEYRECKAYNCIPYARFTFRIQYNASFHAVRQRLAEWIWAPVRLVICDSLDYRTHAYFGEWGGGGGCSPCPEILSRTNSISIYDSTCALARTHERTIQGTQIIR